MKISPRDLILGGQDGLVNVLGIILGLSAAATASHTIVIAGLAAGFSEAVSMGAVAYTSARADRVRTSAESTREISGDAFVVACAALIGAVLPVVPFMFLSAESAVIVSIIFSLCILFALGAGVGKSIGMSRAKSGVEILFIGSLAAFAGFIIGVILK